MTQAGERSARPSGAGFSLKDHLFNAESLGDLAREIAAGVPDFDAATFRSAVLPGLPPRALKERIAWIADCLEPHLSPDFPAMADQIEAALPPELDPARTDDDFGRFIHAPYGELAVRHGMAHPDRALNLLHAVTRRFSMEAYIRPFVARWPQIVLPRMALWTGDANYHVRRLVSEGLRPRLPWAVKLPLDPVVPLAMLDALHDDPTRYVTRSVANHLNDLTRTHADAVLERLARWRRFGLQDPQELDWMARHALRTLVKTGHAGALAHLGYAADAQVTARLTVPEEAVIGGVLTLAAELSGPPGAPVLVDYEIVFARPRGTGAKVYKWTRKDLDPGGGLSLTKTHRLKADATTFTLHPGRHAVRLMVNGVVRAEAAFALLDAGAGP